MAAVPPSAAIGDDAVLLVAVASVKAAVEDNATTVAANRRFWGANCSEANPTGGDWILASSRESLLNRISIFSVQ